MAQVKTNSTTKKKTPKKKSDTSKSKPLTGRKQRIKLISDIEKMRGSKVITYIVGDRTGAPFTQIGDDAVRPMYDHIRDLPADSRVDIFLYSRGGGIEVPWRMVSTLRGHCKYLSVLIPYRAYSAATLIALGCDEIVMGLKAELGPIDPMRAFAVGNKTEHIAVEDVMSFVRFIKEVAGLTDQSALSDNVHILTDKLSPWAIGSIYRIHAHIRIVAQKMLSCRTKKLDETSATRITEALAEKVYSHGHAICRNEAEDIGLPVVRPKKELNTLLWNLFEAYEDLLHLKEPLDHYACFQSNIDEISLPTITAIIESENITSAFKGLFKLKRIRKTPQQVNINLNIGLQLPPNVDPKNIPVELQKLIKETLESIQKQAPTWIMEQTKKQSPIEQIKNRFESANWYDITKTGI